MDYNGIMVDNGYIMDIQWRYEWEYTMIRNFRILKWRYVSSICLAIFCGDLPGFFRPKNRP